jgi:lectin-like protein
MGLVVACVALGCTLTADEFEPNPAGSAETETGGLTGTEPPLAPTPSPGSATNPSPVTEAGEGADPTAALDPTDVGGDGAEGANLGTGGDDVGQDAGVEAADAGDASAPDASAPEPVAAPPGESPRDASVAPPSALPLDAGPPPESQPPLGAQDPTEPCPGIAYEDSCYEFFGEPLSWTVAEERCVAWGGHLASVESFDEDFFIGIWPLVLGIPRGDGTGIWLGGTDARRDGDFRWADDRPLSFAGWAPNQPDNGLGVDCIQKRNDGSGRWYDLRCSDAEPYVCERPQ